MKKYFTVLLVILFAIAAFAQENEKKTESKTDNPALKLAEETLKTHGGDKLKQIKTLTIIGSVDVTVSAFQQEIPASFVTIFAGEKYRFELNNPFQPIKQIYDGEQTLTNVKNGFTMPPLNRLGFPLIQKIGDEGFEITALPEDKAKKEGFRITSPEGYYTDFYVDKKTKQIKGFDSSYIINGRTVTTSAEIDKFKTVDGVVVPEKYAQRFDLQQMTVYADFKAKQIIVNKEIADDVFTMN